MNKILFLFKKKHKKQTYSNKTNPGGLGFFEKTRVFLNPDLNTFTFFRLCDADLRIW